MKKLIALAMAAAMTASLAGCASSDVSGANTSSSGASSATEESSTTTTTSSDGETIKIGVLTDRSSLQRPPSPGPKPVPSSPWRKPMKRAA